MQDLLLNNDKATCMLVEVIASRSQDISWSTSIDGCNVSNSKIRRVSIDKFYEIATGDTFAFSKLCKALPTIIEDVVSSLDITEHENTVLEELSAIDSDLLKSIYLLSFKKYEGFQEFKFK